MWWHEVHRKGWGVSFHPFKVNFRRHKTWEIVVCENGPARNRTTSCAGNISTLRRFLLLPFLCVCARFCKAASHKCFPEGFSLLYLTIHTASQQYSLRKGRRRTRLYIFGATSRFPPKIKRACSEMRTFLNFSKRVKAVRWGFR